MSITLEVCCGSYEDAKEAHIGGADRIELNSALWLGGLTPSLGSLILCKEEFDFPVIAMARPRGGGFCYTEPEYKGILKDIQLLLENGADGIAFGFLDKNHCINAERTKQVVELIHSYGKEAVFHRAFDCVQNKEEAIQLLINLKVSRILTSGGEPTAYEGISLLKALQESYGNKIEILPGSGLNSKNAIALIKETRLNQIHSSCKSWREDRTTISGNVTFAYRLEENVSSYEMVERSKVAELKNVLERQN